MSESKKPTVEFLTPTTVGPRPWGEELLFGVVPKRYSFKLLKVNRGHKGGLQYHHRKDEMGFVLMGTMIIRFDNGDGKLSERHVGPGDCFHFPPGAVHQEEAVTDCQILEVSTPFFNDRVRVEELYGLPTTEGGLPSTTVEEVEER